MQDIERYIPIGKENAIHQGELANKIGVTPTKLKKIIQEARINGKVICGDSRGYYIARDRDEARAFYNSMRKQAISRFNSVKPIRRSLREFEGQISLFDNVEGAKLE